MSSSAVRRGNGRKPSAGDALRSRSIAKMMIWSCNRSLDKSTERSGQESRFERCDRGI